MHRKSEWEREEKLIVKNAKKYKELQGIAKNNFLLTSGVNSHLGGLEGQLAEATLYSLYYILSLCW